MWRINVVNIGIGTTGLRASFKPANAAQAMKSAERILQPAVPWCGVEKLFPAPCDHAGRPGARSQATAERFLAPHEDVKPSEGASSKLGRAT